MQRTAGISHVPIGELSLEEFRQVLEPARWLEVIDAAARAQRRLAGRVVWNVNSTARGGGVAEMLQSLLGYARGVGVDARWLTIAGDAGFFRLTKRLHNSLHGSAGDGGPLAEAEHELYERSLRPSAEALLELISAEDLVILHDPQTAGLVPLLRAGGARIVWRSHVGHDRPNGRAFEAWRFLLRYVASADACVFSRRQYFWGGLQPQRVSFIHPSIDAFSAKNRALSEAEVQRVLAAAGILESPPALANGGPGAQGAVSGRAQMVEESRLAPDTPLVLQVSRWDRLKDPLGVIEGFSAAVGEAHLLLAGPSVAEVCDDPEGAEVLAEARTLWQALAPSVRERVHLASLPMDDAEENALMVNALQRHATVVCQKSIAEGFGLTVAEAMWKERPVVATRVGGIQDQIEHGVDGLLVDDPLDLGAFGSLVQELLDSPERALRMAGHARLRATEEFLGPDHLIRYLSLFEAVLGRR